MAAPADAFETSLTSLSWLQRLDCESGLAAPLQTPTDPPCTALAQRYAQRTIVLPTRNTSQDRPPTAKQLEAAIRKEHQIPADVDWSVSVEPKPPHNYATLIYMAIKSSKTGKVTLSEIYAYIQENFVFYRDNEGGWKNSIRHNLTQNKFFVRVDRKTVSQTSTAKGGFWSLDLSPKFMPDFNRQVRRFGKTKGKGRGVVKGATKSSRGKGAKNSPKNPRKKMGLDGKPRSTNLSVAIKNPPSSFRQMKNGISRNLLNSDPALLEMYHQRESERGLLSALPDSSSMLMDLYESVGVSGDDLTDIDSVCSDVSRDTGGAESLLDEDSSSAWIRSDEPMRASSLRMSQLGTGTGAPAELSGGLARFADTISPQNSLSLDTHSFDVDCMLDLVSSFAISDDDRMLPTGGDLQVVGVGMSLFPPKEDPLEIVGVGMTMFPTAAVHHCEPASAGPQDDLSYIGDQPIPADWVL